MQQNKAKSSLEKLHERKDLILSQLRNFVWLKQKLFSAQLNKLKRDINSKLQENVL